MPQSEVSDYRSITFVFIFKLHLFLTQTTIEYDRTVEDLFDGIKILSQANFKPKMVALAIMAHGDGYGNMLDVNGKTIKVQTLVNEMRQSFPDTPMVCLLVWFMYPTFAVMRTCVIPFVSLLF